MRTIISISDHLLEEAKKVSQMRNCTLGEVVDEALALILLPQKKKSTVSPKKAFKTFSGRGVQDGIELDSNSAMAEVMESR
jgi:hypothetical protein